MVCSLGMGGKGGSYERRLHWYSTVPVECLLPDSQAPATAATLATASAIIIVLLALTVVSGGDAHWHKIFDASLLPHTGTK